MKIGIFGDSFSYEEILYKTYSNHANVKQIGKSWVTYLREDFDIINYSVKGCESFYMYNKFLEEHEKYDKILFMFPRPGRVSVSVDGVEIHIPHVFNVEEFINLSDSEKEKNIYTAYKYWHDYIYNDAKECFFANLLVEEIKKVRSDVFFMYGANWNFYEDTLPITHISHKENDAWNESFYTIRQKYIDLRYNHLTKENNEILSMIVKESILNSKKIKIDSNKFYKPTIAMKQVYLIEK